MASSQATDSSPPDGTGQSLLQDALYSHLIAEINSPGVIQLDPWLEPFQDALKQRFSFIEGWVKAINETEGGLEKFSKVSTLSSTISWSAIGFGGIQLLIKL
jgi:spermidine synthase